MRYITTEKRKNTAKEIFKDAFLRLLKRKEFRKITIVDLTKESGLSRTTFYNYYADPYEILEEITDDYIDEFYETAVTKDKVYTEPMSEKAPTKLFAFALSHREILQVLLKTEIRHILLNKWKTVNLEKIMAAPERYLPIGLDKKYAELWAIFWFDGVWALISSMILDSKDRYSIKEYENMFYFAQQLFRIKEDKITI